MNQNIAHRATTYEKTQQAAQDRVNREMIFAIDVRLCTEQDVNQCSNVVSRCCCEIGMASMSTSVMPLLLPVARQP
jgi:hypothetical protein